VWKEPKKKLHTYNIKYKIFSIYFTKKEELLFETAAKRRGLTVSKYLHTMAFDIIKDFKKKSNKIMDKSIPIKLFNVDEVFKKFLTEDEINHVDKDVEELYKI